MAAPAPWAQAANGWARRVPPWLIYLGGAAWMAWLFWRGLTDFTLIEPIDWLEREYGLTALQLLCATLAVSPLRRFAGLNLLRFRRALGVTAFAFALAHLLVWAVLDVRSLALMWDDVVERPYVTVGLAAFLMLLPLALTSNDASLRRLGGAAWRRLHRLTYPAVVLGAVHFVWLARGFALEPLVYLGLALLLLALRLPAPRAAITDAGAPTRPPPA